MIRLLLLSTLLLGGCFIDDSMCPKEVKQQLVWINFLDFDSASIGTEFTDKTEVIKIIIIQVLRNNYKELDVVFISSDEVPEPTNNHSTIYFGGSHTELLGLADSVDHCNFNLNDKAIVFVENFKKFSGLGMSVEQLSFALGRVASHELGHLLGMVHSEARRDFMFDKSTIWELAGVY